MILLALLQAAATLGSTWEDREPDRAGRSTRPIAADPACAKHMARCVRRWRVFDPAGKVFREKSCEANAGRSAQKTRLCAEKPVQPQCERPGHYRAWS